MPGIKNIIRLVLAGLLLLLIVFLVRVNYFLPSKPHQYKSFVPLERKAIDSCFYRQDNSWILRNPDGLWEMYVEGSPMERGASIGTLSQELIVAQEKAFVAQIEKMIPSKWLTKFLRVGIGIYNRNLGDYIPEENKEEIYAISQYASPEFNWIGNNYQRIMNYHSAHDIGHAVQVMGFVGCSALGVWDERSRDSALLIGRNFDFYVGDDFAKEKMVLFMNPDQGYKHALVTWGGMTGVVSGMNEKGLVVLLNAAPTGIPFSSATPVSILAREILQYACNIDEATALAQKRTTFVSEQFIIGSAADHRMVSIEKTPAQSALYAPGGSIAICTNQFQGKEFSQLEESRKTASGYRYKRMQELSDSIGVFDPQKMVGLLRDTKGLHGQDIGLGNEKSINQLIAHHSIVFQPAAKTFWISTAPYQEGKFLAYNLDSIFAKRGLLPSKTGMAMHTLTIAADTAFIQNELKNYTEFKRLMQTDRTDITSEQIRQMLARNPNSFEGYRFAGDCFFEREDYAKAQDYYRQALQKEIPNQAQRERIEEKMVECDKHRP